MARNRSALVAKLPYTAPLVKPASAATRSSDARWYPSRTNTVRPAASSASRVAAFWRVRLFGEEAVIAISVPTVFHILLVCQLGKRRVVRRGLVTRGADAWGADGI